MPVDWESATEVTVEDEVVKILAPISSDWTADLLDMTSVSNMLLTLTTKSVAVM